MGRNSSVLDSLRAVAVTLVLVDHVVETIGVASSPISIRIAWQLGRLGVILFFVHTTCVLMMSMARRGVAGSALVKDFYVRRAFRIYPLALATVATVILFGVPRTPWSGFHPELTPATVLSNVLLVQDLTGATSLLGPMWSLSPEVLTYLALPFLFLIIRARPLLSTVATLWICAVIVAVVVESAGGPQLSVAYFAPCFMSGVVAFWVGERRGASRWPFWTWALALSSIIALYLGIGTLSEKIHVAAAAWCCCLLLGGLLPGFSETGSTVVRVTTHVVAKYSYGIYLGHMIALWLAFSVLSDWSRAVQWGVFAAAMVALPCAGYHLIEEPLIQIGNKVACFVSRPRLAALLPEISGN
jgi:peptidoglycan/LPS O-acetylase OafA/YrhL